MTIMSSAGCRKEIASQCLFLINCYYSNLELHLLSIKEIALQEIDTGRKGVLFYQKISPKHVQFHQTNKFLVELDMFWRDFLVELNIFSTSVRTLPFVAQAHGMNLSISFEIL